MPSAFTHAIVGAAISRLAPRRERGVRLAVELGALAALPDLDVIGFRFGIPYAHPLGHRGLTHSLVFAALLAPLAISLLHRRVRVGGHTWWALVGLSFAAVASHGLLDMCTDAGLGVGLFIPFDTARRFFPWRPITTSPLSVRAFFDGSGARVLLNEAMCVWLPVGLASGLLVLWRRQRRLTR